MLFGVSGCVFRSRRNAHARTHTLLSPLVYVSSKDIYSLLALAAFFTKHYGMCSRALGRLETLDTLTEEERAKYANLALQIFTINKVGKRRGLEKGRDFEGRAKDCVLFSLRILLVITAKKP